MIVRRGDSCSDLYYRVTRTYDTTGCTHTTEEVLDV